MKCFVLYAPLVASFSYKDWKNKKERPKQVEAISVNKFLPAPSIDHSLHSNHMFCLSVTQFSTPASLASSHYFALLHIFQSSSLYLFCFPWPSILQMTRGPGAQLCGSGDASFLFSTSFLLILIVVIPFPTN